MRSRGMRPSKRANVSSSRVLSETRRRSCLGRARRLNGQKRSPLPPASMSAYIESGMLVQAGSRRENCRFFFQNATYMVGDVFPDIHFKNFRASSSGPTAYADSHRDRPGLGNSARGQDQTSAASGSRDCACGSWRVGSRAVAHKNHSRTNQSTGIRMGQPCPFALYSRGFGLQLR